MTDRDKTEQDTTEDTSQDTETITPATTNTTGIKNPEKLLELFNAQKSEIKELKAFKASKEAETTKQEEERLKRESQYEALIPLKVKEATEPLNTRLTKLEKEKAELLEKLGLSTKQFEELQTSIKTEKVKSQTYSQFLASGGDTKTSQDTLWKLYGDKVTVDEKGQATNLDELIKTLKTDDFGSKLFVATVPEGSGTPQQKTSTPRPSSGNAPKVVTKAMLLNPKKNGFTMEDVNSGKVVVEN